MWLDIKTLLEAEPMDRTSEAKQAEVPQLVWHDDHPGVTAYLDRCQVDTPDEWVQRVWKLIAAKRCKVGSVVEFGAGDGRFSCFGKFSQYVGYEVDSGRAGQRKLPSNAQLLNACAFSTTSSDADVCIGNPPYVRNQDLPAGWREQVGPTLNARLSVKISGLANAWQYFFFHALASTRANGLIALIVPYEWVSRPSSKVLREFIKSNGWSVDVYRLPDSVFGRVLTTSSITVVDKNGNGAWRYFDTDDSTLEFMPAKTASLGTHKVIEYALLNVTLEAEDRVKDMLQNVRLPSAQLDFFSLIVQLAADHLIWQDSGDEERAAFNDILNLDGGITGASQGCAQLCNGAAIPCHRATHWYARLRPDMAVQ